MKCDQKKDCPNVPAEKPPTLSMPTSNLDVSDMSPAALAEWLLKEIGELYLADINKLKGIQMRVE